VALCAQVSEDLAPHVHDAYILKDVEHSDHCPLGIVIKKDASG
jgi:exonuclease III